MSTDPEEDLDDDFDDDLCSRCGGQGYVEYNEAPESWGEDCPSEPNHLIDCPECGGTGANERRGL